MSALCPTCLTRGCGCRTARVVITADALAERESRAFAAQTLACRALVLEGEGVSLAKQRAARASAAARTGGRAAVDPAAVFHRWVTTTDAREVIGRALGLSARHVDEIARRHATARGIAPSVPLRAVRRMLRHERARAVALPGGVWIPQRDAA